MTPRRAEICLEEWENGRGGGRERKSYCLSKSLASCEIGAFVVVVVEGGQNRGETGKGAHNKV